MANLGTKLITLKAKEFNIKRKLLSRKTTCVFLAEDGELAPWSATHTAVSGWLLDYSTFLQMPVLFYASADDAVLAMLENSTHVAIDSLVYEIQKPSVAPPDGKRPFFRIPLAKTAHTYP